MKITKTELKQIIKEELERSVEVQDAEDKLVNAVLDLQKLRGDAYVVKVLKEMIISIEAGR